MEVTANTRCPQENTLAALCDRQLAGEALRKLGRHIDECPRCREVLAVMARSTTASTELGKRLRFARGTPAPSAWTHQSPVPAAGGHAGRYRIERVLGSGGMGVVYEAYDPELDRRVALKLIRPDLHAVSDEVQGRLVREAKAQAQLSHPNVVGVYDVGSLDGQFFVAMELVDGVTLKDWLRKERRGQRRGQREILRVFLAAGRGLLAAHEAGLVHRDFKPDNVLVGADGRVRVADFGLARSAGVAETGTAGERATAAAQSVAFALTCTGVVLGTPAYMAPEQHAGDPTDARTDEFSFCVALYEALYDERPFEGRTAAEIGAAARAGEVRKPAKKARVPKWLRKALLRGLRADPGERYPTMRPLLRALSRSRRPMVLLGAAGAGAAVLVLATWAFAVSGNGGPSCGDAGDQLAGVWDADRRAAIRAALLESGTPQAMHRWQYVEKRIDAFSEGWVAMRREVCLAAHRKEQSPDVLDLRTHCLDTQLHRLQKVTGLLASGDAAVAENALDSLRGLPRLERCSTVETLEARVPQPVDESTRAEVDVIREEVARADVLRLAGKFKDALAILEPLEQRTADLGYRPVEAEVLYYLGIVRGSTEGPHAAEKTLRRAAYAAEAGRHDELAAEAWIYLVAVAAIDLNDSEQGHEYAGLARAAIERLGGDPGLEAHLELNQGGLYFLASDLDKAQASFRRAVELSPGDSESRILALERSAQVYEGRAQFDEAIETYEYVLRERARVLGPDHPDVGIAHTNIAGSFMQVGRLDEAFEHANKAFGIFEKTYGPDHLDTARARYNIAELLQFRGYYERSLEQHTLALVALERIHGPEHLDVARALVSQGELLVRIERAQEAVTITRRALAILERGIGEKHFETARCLINFGDALREAGQYEESLTVARRGLVSIEAAAGKDTAYSGFGWTGIGRTLLDSGKPAKAIKPLERALSLYEQGGIDPAQMAVTRFALARALWESGRDRKRAGALAKEARAVFAAAGRGRALELGRADKWLAGVVSHN